MIKELLKEIKKATISVVPIYLLVIFLKIINIIELSYKDVLLFSIATIFIIIGISLFNFGAEYAIEPIGKNIGRGLTKKGEIKVLLVCIFIFGFLITVSEPDLFVLATQINSLYPKLVVILLVSFAVALFLLLAVIKIIKKIHLVHLLSILYMIAFGITIFIVFTNKTHLIPLSFDSGGVTTGPMTVPFLMALGGGVASVLALKSERDSSFGFVAFSSIGPIIVILILSLISKNNIDFTIGDYSFSDNYFLLLLHYILDKMKTVGISIGLIYVAFLVVNFFFLKNPKKKVLELSKYLLFTFFGLVIFLAFVDAIYLRIGYKIGGSLSQQNEWIVYIIMFFVGVVTVLAEPAVKILTRSVENITNGLIKKRTLLIVLSISIGIALMVHFIRIILKIDIIYFLIIGYTLCFILSFFIPRIYTAIAFDAGGVTSGPLTSSFILPIALGFTLAECSINEVLSYGFGIVAFVALSPILAIELLGVLSRITSIRKTNKKLKSLNLMDDKSLIVFGE